MYQESCNHINDAANIPKINEKPICEDCGCLGPNLWICLSKSCYRIGCSEKSNDHSTLHNINNPSHCIHMNLDTKRIWCYECKNEVFFNQQQLINNRSYDSDQDMESTTTTTQYKSRIDRDSGHGSYTTLKTTNSLNVGMGGDTSGDNSENDEPSTTTTTTTTATTNSDYNLLNHYNDRPMGLVGLQNIGNTCYMNAALQALSNAIPLTRFFLENALIVDLLSEGKKPGLSRTYQALMREMWRKNGGYVTPSGILYGIRNVHATFRGFYQHDTQEFLRNFMDQLHEELKQPCPPETLSSSLTTSIIIKNSTSLSDSDTFCLAMDEPAALSSSYDSSEGEYETCDSGVSERSSLSDDTERLPQTTATNNSRRRISRSLSPGRRLRTRLQSSSMVIDSQPSTSTASTNNNSNVNNINNKQKQQKYRSIISDIFDGKLLSSVQCLTCDRISSRIETFQDLSLPIPSRDHLVVLHGRNTATTTNINGPNNTNSPGTCTESVLPVSDGGWLSWILSWLKSWFYGPVVTLHDCLSAFFSTDELKGDNMYSCEKCNKLRNGIKFSKVLQLPEILCIHLKRFRHELMFSSKISSFVSFPLKDLDMRPYLHNDCISKITTYELFSVICHYGTAGGGHYICYALNNNQWYEFDDQYVTRVTAEKVQSCEAYVLFYRKISPTSDDIRLKANQLFRNCSDCIPNEIAYISKQWISRFNTCCEPGGIDNSDFLCQHGSIDPDRASILDQLIIPIPLLVYQYLYENFGGCPPITSIHICPACLAINNRIQYEMQTFIKLNHDVQNNDIQMTHLLSTNWYTQWQKFIQKLIQEPPGPIDNSKITNNTNHQININECFEIPEMIWNFFYNIYGGGPEIRLKQNQPIPNYSNNNNNNNNMNDDDLNTNNNDDDDDDSEQDDVTDFVIPTLKKNEPKKDVIDKKFYSTSEPMNIDDNSTKNTNDVNSTNGFQKTNRLNNNEDDDGDNENDDDYNDVEDEDGDGNVTTYVHKFNNERYRRRQRRYSRKRVI